MIFKGKTVLVTGASRGIGRAISEMFSFCEAIVIGTSTNISGVEIINTYLNNKGKGMQLDVSRQSSIDFFLAQIYKEFGDIDILVNNAGIVKDNILLKMKDDEWQSVINVNLTSVYRISKGILKSMIKKRSGKIISIGSMVSLTGNIGQVNYSSSKSGLIGFTRSLAREVASRGITVNLVAPGFINTDMVNNISDKRKHDILSNIPMNRFGIPKDVAYSVAFLASDYADYITGQTIHVNGGIYMG